MCSPWSDKGGQALALNPTGQGSPQMAAQSNAVLAAQPQPGQRPQPHPGLIPLVLWWLNLPGPEPPASPAGVLGEALILPTPGFRPVRALAGWARLQRGLAHPYASPVQGSPGHHLSTDHGSQSTGLLRTAGPLSPRMASAREGQEQVDHARLSRPTQRHHRAVCSCRL